MEKQKTKHISEFNEGEIITRIKSGIKRRPVFNNNLGIAEIRDMKDASYIRDPVRYVGIVRGRIYVEFIRDGLCHNKGETHSFCYDAFQDGWIRCVPEERMLNKEDAQRFLEDIIKN